MVVFPVTVTVRLRLDTNRTSPSEAKDRIERAIRRAYKDQNRQFKETLNFEKNPELEHGEEEAAGKVVEATFETYGPFAQTLSKMQTVITRQIESEFNHDINGARILAEDESGSKSGLNW